MLLNNKNRSPIVPKVAMIIDLSQNGRLPELSLAYSCLTNQSEAASLSLVTPKQTPTYGTCQQKKKQF